MEQTLINNNEQQITFPPIQETEITGLTGSVPISELVLQRIWLKQNFRQDNLQTSSQKSLEILHPGYWNRLGGPDFKNATLLLNGQKIQGDVEIHFYSQDWENHKHHKNPAYNNTILHVILFPSFKKITPEPGTFRPAEELTLLPVLYQDLEEYLNEETLLGIDGQDLSFPLEKLLAVPLPQRFEHIQSRAWVRYHQKTNAAHKRLSQNTWPEACHQTFLEILGYKNNRSPMATIAKNYPHHYLTNHPEITAEELYNSQKENWKLTGIRPANHPLKRLQQYLTLLKKHPNWPNEWQEVSSSWEPLPFIQPLTKHFRKSTALKWRHEIIARLLEYQFSGTKLNTLIIDGLLPLAAAHHKLNLFSFWYHWAPGDMPDHLNQFLRNTQLLDSKEHLLSNGLNQGILLYFYELGIIQPSPHHQTQ